MRIRNFKTAGSLLTAALMFSVATPVFAEGGHGATCEHGPKTTAAAQAKGALVSYERVWKAFAADDWNAARAAADELAVRAQAEGKTAVAEAARAVAAGKNIGEGREAFKALSQQAIVTWGKTPGYQAMTCPMIKNGEWLQPAGKVANPYAGKAMLECGSVRK